MAMRQSDISYIKPTSRNDFKIAIICALTIESSAIRAVFDEEWESYGKLYNDFNSYTVGRIGQHNVVLVHLPAIGGVPSASATANFRLSYPFINLALLVGICGGNPIGENGKELFLGDVVISDRVVQYAYGRRYPDRLKRKDTLQPQDSLSRPSAELRAFLHKIRTVQDRKRLTERTISLLDDALQMDDFLEWKRPGLETDKTLPANYRHKHQKPGVCKLCDQCCKDRDAVCDVALKASCSELECNLDQLGTRDRVKLAQENHSVALHFGVVASADEVMKSGIDRDKIAQEEHAIAFEMEGAGSWDNLPTVVVKSVCDYADSHKNKDWQRYASLAAACSMKALVECWTTSDAHSIYDGSREIPQKRLTLSHPVISQQRLEHQATIDSNPEVQKRMRESLHFREHDKRQGEIVEAHRNTCSWVFEKDSALNMPWSNFVEWLEEGKGIYWIKGKPGAGKSTLMSYIAEDDRSRASLEAWAAPSLLLIGHFFYCYSGNDLQKNETGLLRSLLYQFLEQQPSLIMDCFQLDAEIQRIFENSTSVDNSAIWTEKRLLRTMRKILNRTSSNLKMCLFIDGLDESTGDHCRLAELLLEFTEADNVKICVSSRELNAFNANFAQASSLRIQDLTYSDIKSYVADKLGKHNLFENLRKRDQTEAKYIIEEIAEKSCGVFLWTKLVVKSILQGLMNYDGLQELRARVNSLPDEIETLYERIFSTVETQSQYFEESAKLFQIVVAAEGTELWTEADLWLLDLSFALETPSTALLRKPASCWPEPNLEERCRIMRGRLATLSAGLIEVFETSFGSDYDDIDGPLLVHPPRSTRAESVFDDDEIYATYFGHVPQDTVRFIHRSAQEFIQKESSWEKLCRATKSTGFSPHSQLVYSSIMQIRFCALHPEDLLFLVCRSLLCARRQENVQNTPCEDLLDCLDRIGAQLLADYAATIQLEDFYWTVVLNRRWIYKHPGAYHEDFLSFAVEAGLSLYVDTKLQKQNICRPITRRGRPLLHYCFESEDSWEDYLPGGLSLVTINMLLRRGADPHEKFQGISAWELFLHQFFDKKEHIQDGLLDLDGNEPYPFMDVTRTMASLGVDLNATIKRRGKAVRKRYAIWELTAYCVFKAVHDSSRPGYSDVDKLFISQGAKDQMRYVGFITDNGDSTWDEPGEWQSFDDYKFAYYSLKSGRVFG